ncbi:MAG: cation:proton antiporter subunit C [Cyanobacteriota bacterium]|nr:cation:proton antiporter subunit C [Cyanobacteriota bacterium]
MLEALVLLTILLGFLGTLWKQNLIMKILAMDIMSAGVVAYFVAAAARPGLLTPILVKDPAQAYADPVPQAVILTAIVIGLSIQALMLVGAMKLSQNHPTLEVGEIERVNAP